MYLLVEVVEVDLISWTSGSRRTFASGLDML